MRVGELQILYPKKENKEFSNNNLRVGLLLSIVLYGIVVCGGKMNGDAGVVLGIIGAISGCFIAYYIAIRINSRKIVGVYLKKQAHFH